MNINPAAGKPASPSILVNVPRLITAYYSIQPDADNPRQRVIFGTSGHRGSAFEGAFNEWHILAVSQAIADYRKTQKIDGPLFLGIDTHGLSEPAFASAMEVLAANSVEVMLAEETVYTPTPAVSHAVLCYNRGRSTGLADGIVITPSHNPPDDGGFKYDPPARRTRRFGCYEMDRIEGQRTAAGEARRREANDLHTSFKRTDHSPAQLSRRVRERSRERN
ncbi:MAG TPA: hypothetical protein VEJ46_03310 [Candidatus Acidoferrum sp.]|nr:hypothetical protein [Candidatus Acidoferrum sp.]